jgi:hypothetical protein
MPDTESLINAIDAAAESAYGGDSDSDLATERALALDYYYGRNVEPAPEGRSQVSDRSVFETVQWILPSLCRIFANGDSVVELQPFGPEDEKGAKQESDYLNYVVTQRNPWFNIFLEWSQDALLTKNAYCMAYIEEKVHTETESYKGQSDEQVALLIQDEGIEIVEFESYPDENAPPQVVADPMTGQPIQLPPPNKHDITIRRVKPQKRLRFKVLPPERCLVSEQTPSFTLEDCDYFEYYDDVTISSLRAEGFEVPDDIASEEGAESDSDVSDSRNIYNERQSEENPIDPSMKLVRARMVWIRYDYDEDGIAELQKVIRVGKTILDREEASRIPVACIVPNVNPHRHIGTSIADMTSDIQRIKTAILRQGLDNLYLANNPRNIVSGKVNLDDYSISAPGSYVRLNDEALPGEGHVMPIPVQFMFDQAVGGLEYMERVSEGRSGVSRSFSGVDPGALSTGGNKSSGVAINQLSTMASQRVEQIARIMATGVQYLFSVAHELLLKSGHQADVVKLRGEWTTVDPSAWKTGRDMRICVGYGAGNKDALVARLTMIANFQKEAALGGLPIVQPANFYETATELVKASDFTSPQRFFTDPASIPPAPPKPTEAEIFAGVENAKLQSSERVKQADIQSAERIKAAELDQKDRQAQLQAELALVLKQMESGTAVDLERLRGALKNEGEKTKADLALRNDGTKDVGKNVLDVFKQEIATLGSGKADAEARAQKLEQEVNAPREVVREGGKVVGVKVGNKVRRVVRDKDNKIARLE